MREQRTTMLQIVALPRRHCVRSIKYGLLALLFFHAETASAGEYRNWRWGFRAWLPAFAIDCIYEPTSPDQGVMIHLDGQDCQGPVLPPRMAIAVSHNIFDLELLEDLADQDCPEGHGPSPLTLDGLPLLECRKIERDGLVVARVIAFRPMFEGNGLTSHIYTIWWESSADTADHTAALARQIIRSVRLLAVSDER